MQQVSLQNSLQKTNSQLTERFGSVEVFLERFNPSFQMEICGDSNDCYFGEYPTLAEIRKNYGDKVPTSWLIPQLYNLSEYCGVKEKLEGAPLKETAFVIASTYYYFKVTELMLFFHRFKSGRYGRFYGNVDPLVITTALRDFAQERINAIVAKESEERDRELEEQWKNSITWEEYCRLTNQEGRLNHI